jgi:two-component system osmolarity sensor histidine kinase EnvZ
MRLLPKTLVGRTGLLIALLMIGTESAWFAVVRPLFFERPGQRPVYVDELLTWIFFILLASMFGAYVIFFWLRKQLRDVTHAARLLAEGQVPPPLPETGTEEVRDLSGGFNRMARSLDAMEAERRFMLASISHDLRTPLTRLRLSIELQDAPADVSEGMIHDIEDIDMILRQFLDYVRDGSQEQEQTGDINLVVTEVCRRYVENGNPLELVCGSLPHCSFRPISIRRLVGNLLDNAFRYGRQGIVVRTEVTAESVTICVEDRGPGIKGLKPGELVKPFVRGSLSRGGGQGAGLGLSIVSHIVQAHGGHLSLSNREGGGLAVRVDLPLRN